MKDSLDRITKILTHAAAGWPVKITYRNDAGATGSISVTGRFIGVGTDVRILRGERRYALVDALSIMAIPFGSILTVEVVDPATPPRQDTTDA